MSMKQAAEALGMEPAMLAYHLAAKVRGRIEPAMLAYYLAAKVRSWAWSLPC